MTTLETYQQRVFDAALSCGLQRTQARIVVAQAEHETKHFTSNVFKTDNNCFGMKMPSQRSRQYIQRASGILNSNEGFIPYAHYKDVEDSVKDLVLGWHGYNKTDWSNLTSPVIYAHYLKSRGFYGDPESVYSKAMANYFQSNEWLYDNNSAGFASLLLPAGLLLLFFSFRSS